MSAVALELGRKTSTKGTTKVSDEFQSFGKVLRDLLIDHEITTGMGNPNWTAFAERLDTVHYETLRKAITGERQVSPKVMEECAKALGITPETFVEYRVWDAQRQFDPREVGAEAALKNLEKWAQARGRKA